MFSDIIDGNDSDPGWDGRPDNKPSVFGDIYASSGVYYYVIKVKHGEDELIAVDQYCECENGSVDIDCCCPCAGGGYELDCCPNEALMDQEGWTTYTGVLTLNREY